jgi:plastocyanin
MLLACAAALASAAASAAENPAIEAGTVSGGFVWKPSSATVGAGGAVTFRNASSVVPHGVRWTGGPETPSCSGVPVEQEKTSWSGDCTFAQPGSYTFVCTVHPTEMKGTVTVTSGEVPPGPPPPPAPPPESPLQGGQANALKISKHQRGRAVRGTIALSQAGAGGRLEVSLFASQAVLSGTAAPPVSRVGRIVRSPLTPGTVAFSVPLKRKARRALAGRGKLSLAVQVVVAAPGQTALTLNRRMVIRND